MTLADFERLLPRERARRNPAGILYDHPHLNGLIFSIDDSSFTYFEWGEPDSENDDTPTRWFARVSVPQTWYLLTLLAHFVCSYPHLRSHLQAGYCDSHERRSLLAG